MVLGVMDFGLVCKFAAKTVSCTRELHSFDRWAMPLALRWMAPISAPGWLSSSIGSRCGYGSLCSRICICRRLGKRARQSRMRYFTRERAYRSSAYQGPPRIAFMARCIMGSL